MLKKRIITYIKSVVPDSKVGFFGNSIYVTGVSKCTLNDIQNAINEFMVPEDSNTAFVVKEGVCDEDGEVQMPNRMTLIDQSDLVLPVRINKEVAPKLAENNDIIRYITAAKMLWPSVRVFVDADELDFSYDVALYFTCSKLKLDDTEYLARCLCNNMPENFPENYVYTFCPRIKGVVESSVEITALLEV